MGVWGMRRVLTTTLVDLRARDHRARARRDDRAGLHGARPHRRPVHASRAVGRAHDLPEDGQLPPAHAALLVRRVAAGDHLDRRAGRHHPRRDAGRHGAGAAADRRRSSISGGAWFILSPEVGRVRIPRSRRSLGKVLAKPPVLLATVIGFLLIGACAAVEAGVVATFDHGGLEAGIVLAIFSIGSLAGGLSFGHIPIGRWAMARRLAIVAVGLCAHGRLAQHLLARRHAVPRGHRHRAGPGRAVRDDQRERQVQRDRRGVRLDRHGPADRRRRRLGGRRASSSTASARRAPTGRPPASRSSARLVAVACVRAFPDLRAPRSEPDPRHRAGRHDHLTRPACIDRRIAIA